MIFDYMQYELVIGCLGWCDIVIHIATYLCTNRCYRDLLYLLNTAKYLPKLD